MKSGPEMTAKSYAMVAECIALIRKLLNEGKRVVCIFDFDAVLGAVDDDAVFKLLGGGRDAVFAYLQFQERLAFQPVRPGPWMPAAEECKKLGVPIYIATARGDFLSVRGQRFVLEHEIRPLEMYCVGTQSKRESYRCFADRHRGDSDCHFILIDDTERHIKDFLELARELGIADRAHTFQAIPVFEHTEEEYRAYYATVMNAPASGPDAITVDVPGFGTLLVVPGGLTTLRHIQEMQYDMLRRAAERKSKESGPPDTP